ncbi:hypothetical protein ACLH0L_16215, partial [Aeromonas media]
MAAPIIPDPDDPGHYEWDSEPEPVKQTRWRRLLGWLGKLLLAALVSSLAVSFTHPRAHQTGLHLGSR